MDRLNAVLVARQRQQLGRNPTPSAGIPSAGIIDTQSVPTTESGGLRGVDMAKRINGRHIVTDTKGLLLAVQVHQARSRK